ncbi:MAG: MoaD/ThiS family protein [Candidatus Poribacteria bacterium]|nr:MoaD/ThiS family protein [Candidatus Poribacteria bacterium]
MPTIVIPPLMRKFTDGEENVALPGATVREVINNLESRHPGMKERLCEEDRLKPGIAVYINGLLTRGSLLERVDADAEIHFLPAIGGGMAEPSN